MQAKPCLFDYWRNFVPVAPEITFDARNSETTRYSLRSILLQGARDEEGISPTDGVLDKVPSQRGWRCLPIITSDASRGTISLSRTGDEFIYEPRSGYTGPDCFNYVLTNGTQQSYQSTVYVNVIPWYTFLFKIYRMRSDRTLHRFTANKMFAASLVAPVYTEYRWYYNQYRAIVDDKGVTRIRKVRQLVAQTQASYNSYNNFQSVTPTVANLMDKANIDTYFDTALGDGFAGDSNIPYSPKGTQGEIELEVRLYTKTKYVGFQYGYHVSYQVDLSTYYTVNLRVSDVFGSRWWDSGNILLS